MSNGNCEFCFEKARDCICVWTKCHQCGRRIPESHASEYRGRVWCEEAHDFDEQVSKRDYERAEVIQETKASVKSQRIGEFVHNRGKYHLDNVASDGLPTLKVREPHRLQEYEGRI
jgi:hypothetical protein